MSEIKRVIIVFLVVGGYNIVLRYFGYSILTDTNVIISILIAMAVYSALVLFYRRKKRNSN
jgi:hypothetical protein